MSSFITNVSWETNVSNVAITWDILDPPTHIYTCEVSPINPNDKGSGDIVIGYYLVDFLGNVYEITNITGSTITVYDINEGAQTTEEFVAPYQDQTGFIYKQKKDGSIYMSQSDIRRLDQSARDLINQIDNNMVDSKSHNDLEGLQGGTAGEYLHITSAQSTSLGNIANWDTAYGWGDHAGLYALLAHNHSGVYEPVLGNPAVDGYVLSSTVAGVRSWIEFSSPLVMAGSDKEVLFNSSGAIGASPALKFDTDSLIVNYQLRSPDGVFGVSGGSDLIVKAGNADSNWGGYLYLSPGNDVYDPNNISFIFLGAPDYNLNSLWLFCDGVEDDIDLQIWAKGSGMIALRTSGTVFLDAADAAIGVPDFVFTYTDAVIRGRDNATDSLVPNLSIIGHASTAGDTDGGNVKIYGGLPAGAGARGNVYFGDGSAGYLPAKVAETNVVYYDDTTGRISYGTVSGGSGGGYWSRTGTTIKPTTAGDTLSIGRVIEEVINDGVLINSKLIVDTGKIIGLSRFKYGVEINYSSGDDVKNNFTVNSENYIPIFIDSSDDSILIQNSALAKIGFFGVTPSIRSDNWEADNNTGTKAYDIEATTINELSDVIGTLINELISKGLIGAIAP